MDGSLLKSNGDLGWQVTVFGSEYNPGRIHTDAAAAIDHHNRFVNACQCDSRQ
jgi:hypothetical protein